MSSDGLLLLNLESCSAGGLRSDSGHHLPFSFPTLENLSGFGTSEIKKNFGGWLWVGTAEFRGRG